jgi:hypothetical protein
VDPLFDLPYTNITRLERLAGDHYSGFLLPWVETNPSNIRFFPTDIRFYLAPWYYANGLRMSVYSSVRSQMLDGLVSSHPFYCLSVRDAENKFYSTVTNASAVELVDNDWTTSLMQTAPARLNASARNLEIPAKNTSRQC